MTATIELPGTPLAQRRGHPAQLAAAVKSSHDGGVDRFEQNDRAGHLRDLHHLPTPLVLPNAWDAASARAVVAAGFPAVATTSGGVAASLGWADGEMIPFQEMFAAVARITRSVDVPLSADVESGYGLPPGELAELLVASGAVGCNLEDTDHAAERALLPVETQAGRIVGLKEAALELGVDLVVNARIDVFVRRDGAPLERVDLALGRAQRYVEAGADCVYPIAASEDQLARFVSRHRGPVNGMVMKGLCTLEGLRGLSVARISFGSALQRLSLEGLVHRLEVIAAGEDAWERGH